MRNLPGISVRELLAGLLVGGLLAMNIPGYARGGFANGEDRAGKNGPDTSYGPRLASDGPRLANYGPRLDDTRRAFRGDRIATESSKDRAGDAPEKDRAGDATEAGPGSTRSMTAAQPVRMAVHPLAATRSAATTNGKTEPARSGEAGAGAPRTASSVVTPASAPVLTGAEVEAAIVNHGP